MIAHCAKHFGHPAANCTICKIGGVFAPEASSLRGIAAHRRKHRKLEPVEAAIAVFGRNPKR